MQSYPNTMLTGQNSDPTPERLDPGRTEGRRPRRRRRRPIQVGGRRRLDGPARLSEDVEEYAPRHRAEDDDR